LDPLRLHSAKLREWELPQRLQLVPISEGAGNRVAAKSWIAFLGWHSTHSVSAATEELSEKLL